MERQPADYFFSRLAASPGATRLLSAGWLWAPWDAVVVYDLAAALADPRHLDELAGASRHTRYVGLAEESRAVWLDEYHALLAASLEPEDPADAAEAAAEDGGPRLLPGGLAVFDVRTRTCRWASPPRSEPIGTLMPVGREHLLSPYNHSKLIALRTGTVVAEWQDLRTGRPWEPPFTPRSSAGPPGDHGRIDLGFG